MRIPMDSGDQPELDGILFKFKVVKDVIDGRAEAALERLSSRYGVPKPEVRVGRVKGRSRSRGCYDPRRRIIYAASSDQLRDPRVILHEFYHHLRCSLEGGGGAEKYADRFAEDFVRSYLRVMGGSSREEVG
ncbi:MAG: hypothetical protein QW569_00550 [Candidatus Bathyarchaeia archaeon]|nr:hypothetical protein [Candidatus Bathyarchaeota archaeon]